MSTWDCIPDKKIKKKEKEKRNAYSKTFQIDVGERKSKLYLPLCLKEANMTNFSQWLQGIVNKRIDAN